MAINNGDDDNQRRTVTDTELLDNSELHDKIDEHTKQNETNEGVAFSVLAGATMEGVGGGDESHKEDTPYNSEVVHKGRCLLEVVDEDDAAAVPPVPIAQQLAAEKINKGGMLEVIGAGEDYDENIPPIPIEQLAAALEGPVAASKSKYRHHQQGNRTSLVTHQPASYAARGVKDTSFSSSPWATSSIIPFSSSHQTTTSTIHDVEQLDETAEPYSDSPLPLFQATLVPDEDIFDAVAVRPSWWKRQPKYAMSIFLIVSAAVVAVVSVPSILLSAARNREPDFEDTISDLPVKQRVCSTNQTEFINRTELITAIDQYIEQDCSHISTCDVGEKYGWPMNSWCVSRITEMQ